MCNMEQLFKLSFSLFVVQLLSRGGNSNGTSLASDSNVLSPGFANITIGILVERSTILDFPFGINRTIGLINIGVSRMREILAGKGVNIELIVTPGDSVTCTAERWGSFAAELYHHQHVAAFIGPGKPFEN